MVPPREVRKAAPSKFLTKQPISVPTFHLVISLLLYKTIHSKFLTKQPSSVPTSDFVVSLCLDIFGIVCS